MNASASRSKLRNHHRSDESNGVCTRMNHGEIRFGGGIAGVSHVILDNGQPTSVKWAYRLVRLAWLGEGIQIREIQAGMQNQPPKERKFEPIEMPKKPSAERRINFPGRNT